MSTTLPTIKALGTVWWIEIFTELDQNQTQTVHDNLCLFIADFENKYSRFRNDSLITKLNTTGKLDKPDPMTIDLLKQGQDLYRKTDGLFNILIGEILENTGYDANYSFKPKETVSETPNPLEDLIITNESIILKKGRVDLGGFGKGYLIDLIAIELINKYKMPYFLINGGGDMYATSDNHKPITIYLEHPITPEHYINTTTLLNQGFAASSQYKRRWVVNNKSYNHIINTKNQELLCGTFIKAKMLV
jgi:thiamine biosynthesis lipoprotein